MREDVFLYFDLGNVLLHFSHRLACQKMAAVAGISPELVRQVVFDSGLEWAYERGDISSREFYARFCAATGTTPDYEQLYVASSEIFWVNEAVVETVTALRARGHRLGILSNTCEAHWDYCLANYPLLEAMFGVHALSFRLRAMKPEPRIYAAAAEMVGVPPRAIFFTDDRTENVVAARIAGFDAVLFTTAADLLAALRDRALL
jgi:putative hydrolase of the HAD superfamily